MQFFAFHITTLRRKHWAILFSWIFSSLTILLSGICFAQNGLNTINLKERAEIYIYQGKLDSAGMTLNQLLSIAQNQQDILTEIKCLSTLAEVYQKKDSLDIALSLITRAETKARSFFETDQNNEFADIYQYYGAILMELGQRQEGKKCINKSINTRISCTSENDTLLSYAYNKLGTYYWIRQLYDSSLYFYQKALDASMKKNNPENAESASYYQNVGIVYLKMGNYAQAEIYHIKSLKLKQQFLSENDLRLARIYMNLGYFYFRISLTNKALSYYKLAEQVYLKNPSTSGAELARLYWNIGNYYNILGDFTKSLIYLNNALYIYNENPDKNQQSLIRIHADIGLSYFFSRDYQDAIKNYLYSTSTTDEPALIRIYRNLARSYEYLSDFDNSELYYNKSINKAKQLQGLISEALMLNFSYYANLLYQTDRKKRAFEYYEKAYNICIDLFSQKSRELSLRLYSLGKYYIAEGNYSQSLSYFQNALIAGIPEFSDSSIYINPGLDQIAIDNHLYAILSNKANALSGQYSENPDNKISLQKSIETYELALEVSKKLINAYSSESSQLELMHSVRNTWNLLLKAMYQMTQISKDDNDKKKLFTYAEQSKANLLLNALRDVDAKSYGNIPYTLIEETDILKKDLSYYEKQAYEERLKSTPDESKMAMINNGIFSLKTRYDSLVGSFEQNYPAYYKLKYDDQTISVQEIQKNLSEHQVVLEYALTDTLLLTFTISPNNYEVTAQHIDSSFIKNINQFRQILKHEGIVNYDSADYAGYVHSAYELYRVLLESSKHLITSKEVIVIPDGEIGYLSFDMLLTEMPEQSGINYRTLPYALKKYIFSYSSSANIHFTDFGGVKRNSLHHLLAFAPNYEDFNNLDQQADNNMQNVRNQLIPIPGVKEEVKNILRIYRGKKFLNQQATETEFKKFSEDYNILHLAMHTIIDDINPLYSHMVFAKDEEDTLNDGFLNTYELFNMNFNGELAVLSACNTGTGKLERGEGIMSLARGFIYSGIPSIVMTLWTVEDQPSANLITSFYQYLSQGMPKAIAMNKAKLDYLDQAGPLQAHPYFWAGYVNIGDISPLSIKPRNPIFEYWWALLAIPLLMLFLFIKKRKRSSRING